MPCDAMISDRSSASRSPAAPTRSQSRLLSTCSSSSTPSVWGSEVLNGSDDAMRRDDFRSEQRQQVARGADEVAIPAVEHLQLELYAQRVGVGGLKRQRRCHATR